MKSLRGGRLGARDVSAPPSNQRGGFNQGEESSSCCDAQRIIKGELLHSAQATVPFCGGFWDLYRCMEFSKIRIK